jgi:hypothetical protein
VKKHQVEQQADEKTNTWTEKTRQNEIKALQRLISSGTNASNTPLEHYRLAFRSTVHVKPAKDASPKWAAATQWQQQIHQNSRIFSSLSGSCNAPNE